MTDLDLAKHCVVCGSRTRICLDLGSQPLANALLPAQHELYDVYPLGLAECPTCAHGQLTHFVPPEKLFKNYLYASGTGDALQPYFRWFASALAAGLGAGGRVLEIACNDGSLLDCLRDAGLSVCGVDPAENLTAIARAKGHDVLTGFFPHLRPNRTFDAIVAMNVCAHTPEPRALMQGISELLAPDGTAYIQTSQANMLLNGEFDTIYHEHYSFFTPASMRRLAEGCGLTVEARKLVSVHGGSVLYILRRKDSKTSLAALNGNPAFELPWPSPEPALLSLHLDSATAAAGYRQFAIRANDVMQRMQHCVSEHRKRGATVALVGVAAKALTFIAAAGIEPDHFLDQSTLKIGRFVPGAHRAVESMETAKDLSGDALFIIGAWNFADVLAAKVRTLRNGKPSQFLVYFPELRLFD